MTDRPSRRVIGLELAALVVALPVALLLDGYSDWNLGLLGTLLAMAVVSDLTAINTKVHKTLISSSFLAIVAGAVFLGPTPAALIAVIAILAGWVKDRYGRNHLLINLVTYAWFPLIAGTLFFETLAATTVSSSDPSFLLLVFGLFCVSLAIDFTLIAGYSCYEERSRFITKVQRGLIPLLPSELASALLAVGVAYAYVQIGLAAVALLAVLVVVFQHLVGALLVSQERGDELELRARQLAGFQVALLSALLRTLDLRDKMTARHSAAVARYSREIALQAGMSEAEQELAHTAGLLHDIGKFVLPDRILKSTDRRLTEDDWQEIRKHPYEGARIVSQIDGYAPISDIILAHHERLDGLGYPRGLRGEQIPMISRIIAIADVYDVMTARDSYREPVSSYEAIEELRRVSGTQLDGRFVEAFVEVL
ncbi:MAG: HD-GYP domain-containing protein, partial [Solirubrobacterales bacterium]|nr:HD-GYP domain-containing protein [Solirubrobacterales bacterium]